MKFSTDSQGGYHGGGPISFISFVLLPIFAFSLGWVIAESKVDEQGPPPTEFIDTDATIIPDADIDSIDVSLMRDAISIIKEKFVDPSQIDPEKMKYGIVRGLIWSLNDPYSEFMSPEESEDFEHELDGDLEGIGAELTVKQGAIIVVSPLRDSPAEKAGLLPEDIILKVDGEPASGEDFLNVVKKIRGKKGSTVNILVFRTSTGEEKEIKIKRDKIRVETVELKWEGPIAIIEVSQFGTNTEQEFKKALSEVSTKDAQGIILDLRYNSGGYLDTAIEVVSAFKKTGIVVIQKGRPPDTKKMYTSGNVKTDLPLVVLQNRGSASASEIVAGAIQDLKRGIVVGDQSFGKGTVQEVIPMHDGSHLRITIARWLTPNGRSINKVGITPDILLKRSLEDIENDIDPQMDFAVKYLQGESLENLKSEYNIESKESENEAEQVTQ